MKTPFSRGYFCTLALLAALWAGSAAHAQSSCSSDKQPAPTALLERFISANCATCWATSTLPASAKGQASLDWIVPSPQGDDAALSTAATLDASARLASLGLTWATDKPDMQTSAVRPVGRVAPRNKSTAEGTVRVAHGLPVSGYIGTSIEFKPSAALRARATMPVKLTDQNYKPSVIAHLVLVETLPAGAEGSNVERNLVRNVLTVPWDLRVQLLKPKQDGFKLLFESRPMSLPQGVNPDRLRVVGWVQDAQGKVLATAQSRCAF
jgi:hypothetical protein